MRAKKPSRDLLKQKTGGWGITVLKVLRKDVKAKYRALGKLIDEEKEKLENKWKKSDSDKVEIVTRGGLEIATIAAAF